MNKELRKKALDFATNAHEGQLRKGSTNPYIIHPIAVAEIAEKLIEGDVRYTGLEDVVYVVALLHDVWEDTEVGIDVIADEFGPFIANRVSLLTKLEGTNYFDAISNLIDEDIARIVKMSDLMHNMSDLKEGSLKDKYRLAFALLKSMHDNYLGRFRVTLEDMWIPIELDKY